MPAAIDPRQLTNTVFATDLNEPELQVLSTAMGSRTVAAGEPVAKAGDASRTLFVLLEGSLKVVTATQGGHEQQVASVKPGEVIGLGAFVEALPRPVSVVADTESLLLTMEPADLEGLLESHPRVVYDTMRALFRCRHDALVRMYGENEQLTNYIMKVHGRY